MKAIHYSLLIFLFLTASCSSIRVNADYDKKVDFKNYKTYAYLTNSIDKVEISSLDKKRILNSLDAALNAKGLSHSDTPDLLISFFTQESQRVDIYNNYGYYGWGWNPYWGGGYSTAYTTPEGVLFIDLIDAKTKELVWQGEGSGYLTKDAEKKDERINEFVTKIMSQYPPFAK